MSKISNYPASPLKTQKDTDLVDISEYDGVSDWDTVSQLSGNMKNVMAQHLDLDVTTGMEATYAMDWNCSGKLTAAYRVIVIITDAPLHVPSLEDVIIKIGSTSGGSDILYDFQFQGASKNERILIIPLSGVKPEMLSDSNTYYLTLVFGSGGTGTCDVLLEAYQRDV